METDRKEVLQYLNEDIQLNFLKQNYRKEKKIHRKQPDKKKSLILVNYISRSVGIFYP